MDCFNAGTYNPMFGCLRLFTGEMGMVATAFPACLLETLYPNSRR